MLSLRRSNDRGHAQHGWLDSRHTFSFANYYDPRFTGFQDLLVINEDRVAPGAGFGTHSHQNMEIISYVLEGAIEHRDSTGTGAVLTPGEVQRMSAGTGVAHSEMNASKTEGLHFLQIWIEPEKRSLPPSYEQTRFPVEGRTNQMRIVGSRDGREGSVTIHQDVELYASLLSAGKRLELPLEPRRAAWVQVARGALEVNGVSMRAGDGLAVVDERALRFDGREDAEFLVFDLADRRA
ncbi:Pirin [Labilithrix luteola]|uniref:Pirin n=1 Tax=Labilithrix luteola TaxID=1391654 RepID=A0A0K1PWN3_9BACT|nr:pirin family protein [Labilithrix luteola]AKU97938.1 Pirin [Labilithrix luteola]